MPTYANEEQGKIEFYNSILSRVDSSLLLEDILEDNHDGIVNGNLLEFKYPIKNLNSHIFQCIKYLSSRRLNGKPVPAFFYIVDLANNLSYMYKSIDYLDKIEKVYVGGASKNNKNFSAGKPNCIFDLSKDIDTENFISYLKKQEWTKINIDENCIVGWAESYYKKIKGATKQDFVGDNTGEHKVIGEIRKPRVFKKYINPYKGKDNVKFRYLMDKLNDVIQRKRLGAYFTPKLYANLSHKLLFKAIERVPSGNDYIVLDRCAGTGNLERNLPKEILSHFIVSTAEYYEYKILLKLIGDKVRHLIPPTERKDTFNAGLVTGADALSEEYINNPIINKYINKPGINVILFENPPYLESNGTTKINSDWKNAYVVQEMKKTLRNNPKIKSRASNEIGNVFIWSGFNYYLTKEEDSYILFSPIKYWKCHHLVTKQFSEGYLMNRKHFHAPSASSTTCILWNNIDDVGLEQFNLNIVDINRENNSIEKQGIAIAKKVHTTLAESYYDKRKFTDDKDNGIATELNGEESFKPKNKISVKTLDNDNIVGFLTSNGNTFENSRLNSGFVRCGRYDGHGFFVRKDNYLYKLPLFAATRYTDYVNDWTTMGFIMKTGDGKEKFTADLESLKPWLYKVLFWFSLCQLPHLRTIQSSNGKIYYNEFTFDNSVKETITSKIFSSIKLDAKQNNLLGLWNKVISITRADSRSVSSINYGVYQITDELDTFKLDDNGCPIVENKIKLRENDELHAALISLKEELKRYYISDIVPTLFEYEFLK